MTIKGIFGWGKEDDAAGARKQLVLPEEQREALKADISILGDDGFNDSRLQKVAEKEAQSAAEDSVKKIHIINLGRCPVCGEHLSQHYTANICENCGWNKYDTPHLGGVKVHLKDSNEVLEGDQAYILKQGQCLIMKDGAVCARVPVGGYSWVEYVWTPEELEQRQMQVTDQMKITCGWCGQEADITKDGFHVVHVAFGISQERYCFCSDDCYEAFRKMYPARVHRDCYERNCNDCNLCVKRYGDEAEGIRILAKDRLKLKK